MVKIAFFLSFFKKMFTREPVQVCDNLNCNVATDSDSNTNNDFTEDDFIEEDGISLHAIF